MNWTTIDPNAVMWVLVGAINLITLYYTRKTEKNTNSMKDALVSAASAEAHSLGLEAGRAEGRTTAAILARGLLQGKTEAKEEK